MILRGRRFGGRRSELGSGARIAGAHDAGRPQLASADPLLQAANDYDLSPSRTLAAVMKDAGKVFEIKIYPAYGKSAPDGTPSAISGAQSGPTTCFAFSTSIAI